jgi:uncharacterized protein (TIGR02449 family)
MAAGQPDNFWRPHNLAPLHICPLTLRECRSILVSSNLISNWLRQSMSIDKAPQMGDLELKKLEAGIDEMIRSYDHLREENHALRKQHATLISERASLIEKNEQAHRRVETIIQRLKIMEQET